MTTERGEPEEDPIEAMAKLDFAPWRGDAHGWTPPSNAEWADLANPHLVSVRVAWLTMHKTKEELVAVVETLGDDGLAELIGQLGRSADWFKGLHELLTAAEARIMCACAVSLENASATQAC